MSTISISRFGFPLAGAFAITHAGCVFVRFTVPQEAIIRFVNGIMHAWPFGAPVAVPYNLHTRAEG